MPTKAEPIARPTAEAMFRLEKTRGRVFSVVISVTKVGNTIILDRSTGKPIFDVLYRRANLSNVPNEIIFPYQMDSLLPQRLIKLEYGIEDIADFPEGKNKTFLFFVFY